MNGRSAVILAALFLAGASIAATQKSGTTPAKSSAASTDAILAGAGDIADCADLSGAEATAKLLERIPGTVMAIGDLALPDGAAQQFANCYDKTWGRLKSRTRPAPGNHEFHSSGAAPYFDYFGAVAGDAKKGYYSYDLGTWHIIVLNSECDELGGCGSGSPQEKWLRSDLAAHPVACTLAYWHKPLFSSGAKHGNDPEIKPLWQALYEANADVVVNGHDHDYERFAPQNPDGVRDPARGIREFVVGTGGKNTRAFGQIESTSEAHNTGTFGILKLTLHAKSYDWEFIPIAGATFRDQGSSPCH